MAEERAGAYQNVVVLPNQGFVDVRDSFNDDTATPWESTFDSMGLDFKGWDSRLPESPRILCVGGALREVQYYFRRYPKADITVVNLSRRVLGKLDEFVGNDSKKKQTIHLYLADVTQLPAGLFPQGSFDLITAIRLEESAYEKVGFAAPLMGIVAAEMGLLKPGGFLVQPWLNGYKAYFQSFWARGLVKPYTREYQSAPPFFYERLAPERAAGDSGLDQAMTNKGGIDLNPVDKTLSVGNAGETMKFNIDPALLERVKNAPGLTPVILNIEPLESLPAFLGFKEKTDPLAQKKGYGHDNWQNEKIIRYTSHKYEYKEELSTV